MRGLDYSLQGDFMKAPSDSKAYYFVDESGTPTILGRRGKNLVESGLESKVFMVGYLETADPQVIACALGQLREEIVSDEYLLGIPSMSSTAKAFHANKDCAEVKERVFKLLKRLDFRVSIIVARKRVDQFRRKFDLKPTLIYQYLVKELFKNRLHLHKEIDIYFATMGNTVREHTMRTAIDSAICAFSKKWEVENQNAIRVFVQRATEIPLLQAVDYMLWAVYRVFEHGDYRFYQFLKEKYSVIVDILDSENYPNIYYRPDKPLQNIKMDPAGG